MKPIDEQLKSVIQQLEDQQAKIGSIQLDLLNIFKSSSHDISGNHVSKAIAMLENIQSNIGETQVILLTGLDPIEKPSGAGNNKELAEVAVDISVKTPEAPTRIGFEDWIKPEEWLARRNIEITKLQTASDVDPVADRLAIYLGKHFQPLEEFYEFIKARLNNSSRNFDYSLNKIPNDHIIYNAQFGRLLLDSLFFTKFHYDKSNRVIKFELNKIGTVTNFFTGGWMERYVASLVIETSKEVWKSWNSESILTGASVKLPSGNLTEFDILLGLPKNQIIWIECKTGHWQQYMPHFSKYNTEMHVPANNAVLVTLDHLDPANSASATQMFGFSIVHLSEIQDWLKKAIQPQEPPSDAVAG